MSGRKCGEVLAVLSQNKAIIDKAKNDIDDGIFKKNSEITKISKDIENLVEEISVLKIYKGKNKEVFLKEIQSLETALANHKIKAKQALESLPNPDLKMKNSSLNGKLEELLQKGDAIRKKVSSDYQDANYNAAAHLQNEIRTILAKKSEISRHTDSVYNSSTRVYMEVKEILQNANKKVEMANDYEEQAVMKLNNIEANELKRAVEKSLDKIDKPKAMKFVPADYNSLLKGVDDFLKKTDVEIIKSFSDINTRINKVNENAEVHYAEWEMKTNKLRSMLGSVSGDFKTTVVEDPIDKKMVSALEFERTFLRNDSNDNFLKSVTLIEKNIGSDNFDEAEKQLETLRKEYYALKEKCIEQSIKLKKNIAITQDTVKGLHKLKYNIEVTTVCEDENPIDGYRIKCTLGEEVLDFSPEISDDGKISYNINHVLTNGKEAGNCHTSMDSIYNALVEEGIPLGDITKDGASVISKVVKSKTSAMKQEKSRG